MLLKKDSIYSLIMAISIILYSYVWFFYLICLVRIIPYINNLKVSLFVKILYYPESLFSPYSIFLISLIFITIIIRPLRIRSKYNYYSIMMIIVSYTIIILIIALWFSDINNLYDNRAVIKGGTMITDQYPYLIIADLIGLSVIILNQIIILYNKNINNLIYAITLVILNIISIYCTFCLNLELVKLLGGSLIWFYTIMRKINICIIFINFLYIYYIIKTKEVGSTNFNRLVLLFINFNIFCFSSASYIHHFGCTSCVPSWSYLRIQLITAIILTIIFSIVLFKIKYNVKKEISTYKERA